MINKQKIIKDLNIDKLTLSEKEAIADYCISLNKDLELNLKHVQRTLESVADTVKNVARNTDNLSNKSDLFTCIGQLNTCIEIIQISKRGEK